MAARPSSYIPCSPDTIRVCEALVNHTRSHCIKLPIVVANLTEIVGVCACRAEFGFVHASSWSNDSLCITPACMVPSGACTEGKLNACGQAPSLASSPPGSFRPGLVPWNVLTLFSHVLPA